MLVFRLAGSDISYLEMVCEADFHGGELSSESGLKSMVHWTSRLFNERLEKGVMRKGRIWGLFLPRVDDLELGVAQLCHEARA